MAFYLFLRRYILLWFLGRLFPHLISDSLTVLFRDEIVQFVCFWSAIRCEEGIHKCLMYFLSVCNFSWIKRSDLVLATHIKFIHLASLFHPLPWFSLSGGPFSCRGIIFGRYCVRVFLVSLCSGAVWPGSWLFLTSVFSSFSTDGGDTSPVLSKALWLRVFTIFALCWLLYLRPGSWPWN